MLKFQNGISPFCLMKQSLSITHFYMDFFFLNRDISVETLILKTWYLKKKDKEIISKNLCPAFPVCICKHHSTNSGYLLSVIPDKRKHKCLSQPWRACRVKVRSQERSILTVQEKNVSWQLATYAQHKILEMVRVFFSKYSVCNAFL